MGQLESIEVDDLQFSSPEDSLNISLELIVQLIQNGSIKNICVFSGAGISVSAGIPDFRSPGSGIYSRIMKDHSMNPEDFFDLETYRENPIHFVSLYKEILGSFSNRKPTLAHCFIRLLENKGILLRNYSQNIDGLERKAGISDNRLIEMHGNTYSCSCIDCGLPFDTHVFNESIFNDQCCYCGGGDHCNGLIKPDIVFFGEPLPLRYEWMHHADIIQCDLLIVMGTSLSVFPMCELVNNVREHIPRMLMNRELVGPFRYSHGLCANSRDVSLLGECDELVARFCDLIGWTSELMGLYSSVRKDSEAGAVSDCCDQSHVEDMHLPVDVPSSLLLSSSSSIEEMNHHEVESEEMNGSTDSSLGESPFQNMCVSNEMLCGLLDGVMESKDAESVVYDDGSKSECVHDIEADDGGISDIHSDSTVHSSLHVSEEEEEIVEELLNEMEVEPMETKEESKEQCEDVYVVESHNYGKSASYHLSTSSSSYTHSQARHDRWIAILSTVYMLCSRFSIHIRWYSFMLFTFLLSFL